MRTRLSALAVAGLACLPAAAAANASAVCTPDGGVEVRLEHFVAGRTINVTIQVGAFSVPVRFTGPSYALVVPGPTTAPWTGSVTWQGTRGPVVVPLAGPACIDGTYRPVPEPTPLPVVPVSSPPVVVADTTPPVTPGVGVDAPPPPASPPVVTPPPLVGPPMVPPRHRPVVRRWPAIRCTPKRVWGRRADRTVYRCHPPKRRVPAVTG